MGKGEKRRVGSWDSWILLVKKIWIVFVGRVDLIFLPATPAPSPMIFPFPRNTPSTLPSMPPLLYSSTTTV